jgi:RNA polymerase sigma-70 factor, ECF subfamily
VYTFEERTLVEAAGQGNEDAFARLVDPHRGELYAHCIRMLGSPHDAEDAMQDAMLRAWRALGTYQGRASLRSWLYRIATNVCLDAIHKRPKAPPQAETPASSPAVETQYEHRETAVVALGVALNHLSARQRAVLILRDVLGFSARDTASSLDTSIAAVNSALQRARANLQGASRELADRHRQHAAEGFVDALVYGRS